MKLLKAIALGTVPVVGAFLCILLFHASAFLQEARSDEVVITTETVADESALSQEGIQALEDADDSVYAVSRSASGTLRSAQRAFDAAQLPLAALKGTIDDVDAGVVVTTHRLTDLCPTPAEIKAGDIRECGLVANANRTLTTSRGTLGTVETAVRSFDQHEALFYAQESELNATAQQSALSLADSAKQADVILTDARIEADKLAHPTKKKLGFWGALEVGGDFARHFMPSIF